MPFRPLPPRDKLRIVFAHAAYQMAERFAARKTGIAHREVRTYADLSALAPDANVVCVSMLWKNDLVARAPKLAFIQSISAGTDHYDKAMFASSGIRLASGSGVNANAVAEHAMTLLLALKRHIHTGRDNQSRMFWRPMISEIAAREDEIAGKTVIVVGLGRIGSRFVRFAKAFDMTVIGIRRDPAVGKAGADEVHALEDFAGLVPRADAIVLTCPLTPETENLIDAAVLARMKPAAVLVNVARGKVVDEAALIEALGQKCIAAAALDVTRDEPLPAASPLWKMQNVLITPHSAGETQRYEDNVLDILMENLERQWRGEASLRNQIV